MLAGQRGIVSFPETHFFEVADRFGALDAESGISPDISSAFIGKLQRASESASPAEVVDDWNARASAGDLTSRQVFEAIIATLIPTSTGVDGAGVRWLDKTPGHCAYMQTILTWYPDAQFLCMFRDPVAAIYSAHVKLTKRDGARVPWIRLARRWRACGEQYEQMKQRHPDRIMAVRYERLVKAPKRVLGEIGRFLNMRIDLDAAMKYRETSQALIRPRESWKNDVRLEPLRNTNGLSRVPLLLRLRLQHELRTEMKRYGYRTRFGVLQRAYDAGRRRLP